MKLISLLSLLVFFSACASKKSQSAKLTSDAAAGTPIMMLGGSSDEGNAGGLQTVYFDYVSSVLSPAAKRILDANKAFLDQNKTLHIRIEGHCDERGGTQFNLALGQQRAQGGERISACERHID